MSQPVVILVLAHAPPALRGLLRLLDARFRIIVHLDAKMPAAGLHLPPHASFTAARLPVFWGGFNMMLAIRALIDEAYALAPDFRRAALITGDTLPLLPPERLEAALLDPSREHIDLYEVPPDPALRGMTMAQAASCRPGAELAWRFENFSHHDDALLCPRSRQAVMDRFGVDGGTADYLRGSTELAASAVLRHLPPRQPLYARHYYGLSWWALSRAALDLVAAELHDPAHVDFFRFLQVPDEHFIQTLLGNRQARLRGRITGTPVFVDHADQVRREFGRDALTAERLRAAAGDHLFARKYDPDLRPEIAEAIDAGRFYADVLGL